MYALPCSLIFELFCSVHGWCQVGIFGAEIWLEVKNILYCHFKRTLTLDLLSLSLSLWPPTNCHRDKCQEIGPALMKNCTMNKWLHSPCSGCRNLPSSDPQDHLQVDWEQFLISWSYFTLVCLSKSLKVNSSVSHGCYMSRNIWQKKE